MADKLTYEELEQKVKELKKEATIMKIKNKPKFLLAGFNFVVLLIVLVLGLRAFCAFAEPQSAGEAIGDQLRQKGLGGKEIDRVKKGLSESLGPGFVDLPLRDLVKFKDRPEVKMTVQPIHVPAALFLTPERRNYVFKGKADSFQGSFRTAIIPLGEGIKNAGYAIFSQVFPGLQIVKSMDSAVEDGIYIEPEIVEYKFRYAGLVVPEIKVSAKLRVTAFKGNQQFITNVYEVKDIKESARGLLPTEDQHSRAASMALIELFKQSALEISSAVAQIQMAEKTKQAVKKQEEEQEEKEKLVCQHWKPKTGITNEDKAWIEIGKLLRDSYLNEKIGSIDIRTSLGRHKYMPSDLIKAVDVVNYVIDGDLKKAAETSAGAFLDKLVPIVGQYKAFLDASRIAVQAVIENWVNDLYLHPAYRKVLDLVNNEVQRGIKKRDPFLPSFMAKNNPELMKNMQIREQIMFNTWEESDEFVIDFQTVGWNRGGWHARIRQKYGKDLKPREIFNRFYYKVVQDQRNQIVFSYKEVMEDKMYEEGWAVRSKLIKSICRSLQRANITRPVSK